MSLAGIRVNTRRGVCLIYYLLLFIIAGCEYNKHNFSQYPGFAEYFRSNPPSNELPDRADRHLLYRFRPRFFLAKGEDSPIDFYSDYINNGVLIDGHGKMISSNVTRKILNSHKDNPNVVFEHIPAGEPARGVVYGRIEREIIIFHTDNGRVAQPLTFLTYHIVFRNSGLPAGIPAWQEALLGLLFDLDDWHQLDHYTSVSLVIEEKDSGDVMPIAVMLQQHNNVRTYLSGEGISIPDDGRILIDVAIRSNELYPYMEGTARHRAVYMPDPEGMRFLLSGEGKPIFAAYDITKGTTEVEYGLEFLPPDDAFYTFEGFLGERRMLKGRDSPPGAAYNTIPELKPLKTQLFTGYWRENHRGDIARMEGTILKDGDYAEFARLQSAQFYKNWQQIAVRSDKVFKSAR